MGFKKIKDRFINMNKKNSKIHFNTLTPIDCIDENIYQPYFDAFDFALSEDDICNIAVSGEYGAGKSSLINSFFKRRKIKKVIKISLATFSIEKQSKELLNNEVQEIEKSILQQILYKESGQKFPFSRFSRIKNVKILVYEFLLIGTLLFFITLFDLTWINKLISFFSSEMNYFIKIVNYLFVFVGGICFLFVGHSVTRFLLRIKLTKFSFSKTEFGLDDLSNESLLNKYIDEILYFFEKSKYRIVIFEDLDRFNKSEIFFNLRELNTIINNYEKIKHKVAFIYALRDDVFSDGCRTKFFDFIIPVIPIIDSRNSKDILITRHNEYPTVCKEFLEMVGFYINDMRLLYNCINEYKIYEKIIKNSNKTKLFALIIYKNLYPKDYSDLIHNQGYLYNIFLQKKNTSDSFSSIIDKVLKSEGDNYRKLLSFLLENQYITENYIYHISHYYQGAVSLNDEKFLELVNNNQKPNFELELDEIEYIISKIDDEQWNKNAILNNSLLKFILENKRDYYDEKINKFISTMYFYDKFHSEKKFFKQFKFEIGIDFFDQYIMNFLSSSNDYEYEVFFDETNYDRLVTFFINVTNVSDNKFKEFIKKEIIFLQEIESKEVILNIVIEKLKEMKIQIDLMYLKNDSNIFKKILDNNLYEISKYNLLKIIKNNENKLNNFLTFLFDNKIIYSNVFSYLIGDNWNSEKLNKVISILTEEKELMEEELIFLNVLNSKVITIENKYKFIRLNNKKISDINTISYNDEIWFYLMKENKIEPTRKNILSYFGKVHKECLSQELLNFICNPENIKNILKDFKKEEKNNDEKFIKLEETFINEYESYKRINDKFLDSHNPLIVFFDTIKKL